MREEITIPQKVRATIEYHIEAYPMYACEREQYRQLLIDFAALGYALAVRQATEEKQKEKIK